MTTLPDLLWRSAARHPERIAIHEPGEPGEPGESGESEEPGAAKEPARRLTYRELAVRVRRRAAAWARLGACPGRPVALLLPNGTEYVVSYFAALATGAVVVPVDDRSGVTEVAAILGRTRPAALITSAAREPLCRQAIAAAGPGAAAEGCELWRAGEAEVGVEPWEEGREGPGESVPAAADGPAMLQLSSGSTGPPKLIARSHQQLVRELEALRASLALSPEDRFLGAAPFSHVNGMVRTMLAALASGAALHPVATFGRHQAIELIAREAITLFIGVPFMFSALARTRVEPAADWSSLRLAVSASAAMPPELNREFHTRFGLHVRQLYGSTETGSISVHLEPEIAGTLASVGRPLPGVEVRVLADDGTPVAAGETGEVAVRSPWAIAAYRPEVGEGREGPRAPEETGSFRDGYFLTGDLGRLDPTGRLYLLGRKRFLINRGGYKVNPREIEEVLEAHPAVGDLVVVGEPTVFGDERIKAIVVPRGPCDAATLIAYCRGRIADFKIPSSIEFRDALPKSATGKVRRGLL